MNQSRISQLASIIAEKTAIVDEYLASNNHASPSFDINAPAKLPIPPDQTEIVAAQDAVIASSQELHDLVKGPSEVLMSLSVRSLPLSLRRLIDLQNPRSSTPTMY